MPLFAIYFTFLKIGAVMFGGGMAMLPIVERDLSVKRKYFTADEVREIFALAQIIPGVIALNTAMLAGQRLRGWKGACSAALGVVTVPTIVILAIANILDALASSAPVAAFLRGLQVAVAGLLLGTALKMICASLRSASKRAEKSRVKNIALCIFLISAAFALFLLHVNPALIIISAAIVGAVLVK